MEKTMKTGIIALIVLSFLAAGLAVSGCTGSQVVTATPTPAVMPSVTPAPSSTAVATPVPGSPATVTPTAVPTAAPTVIPAPTAPASNYSWPGYDFHWSPATPVPASPLLIVNSTGRYYGGDDTFYDLNMYVRLAPGFAPISTDDVSIVIRLNDDTSITVGTCSEYIFGSEVTTLTDSYDVRLRIRTKEMADVHYQDIKDAGVTCHIGSENFATYLSPVWGLVPD